ncbi:MAG: hypothetical protein KF736_01410 [Acidobacteria bacterium]|nr:hypothetical protein [Acidobacteriota bacterium]
MFSDRLSTPLFGAVCFIAGALLTATVRAYARRRGFVAAPKADRWHQRPTAMLGGVAIFATTVAGYLLFVPMTTDSVVLLCGSALMFLIGLVDDLLNIRPYQKLIGQFMAAGLVISFGMRIPLTGNDLLDIAITGLWLVGVTNAINLLDNMDGLAAGIAVIASASLAASFYGNQQWDSLALITVFIGALLGFLIFNFNPASIFMGDCGSLFIGFLLAGSVLLNQVGGRGRGILPILAVPVLILFVPIFDTTFVTIIRKLWGRSVSQGGRDHTSHRLVALGLTERSAVLLLYALAIAGGSISILISGRSMSESLALIGGFSLALIIVGVYLANVKVYDTASVDADAENAAFAFIVNLSHKRRIFEVFLDAALITLAYYCAFYLVLGPFEDTPNWDLFLRSLPIVVLVKLVAFLFAGVYRGLWRYTSVSDLATYGKGVLLGSAVSILVLLILYRFEFYSRTVFVVDGLLLLLGVFGSRTAFRLIRNAIPAPPHRDARRVLIYGAGDGGEMVLRELKNNPEWKLLPVGFIDDDATKQGRVLHGISVFGGNGMLPDLCDDLGVDEILVSIRNFDPERSKRLREICREKEISLRSARIRIEPFDFE